MRTRNHFRSVNSQSLSIRLSFPGFASATWTASFKDADKLAAWELYIEMATTVVTQPLENWAGDEKTALESLYSMFATTREVLRKYGPPANECSRVAIAMLNKAVRPFTAKWHREVLADAFNDDLRKLEFRAELIELQCHLRNYSEQLRMIAGVSNVPDPQHY